jgi:dethiobiotin synthetase
MITPRGVLVITGTGTGVGKTIVTAAIAALAAARGERVAVVKPAQTGIDPSAAPNLPDISEIPDIDTVRRLAAITDTHELARFPDPLSPEAAARVSGLPPLDMRAVSDYITDLAETRDLVLVESAGGLLVRYDPAGTTIADLAAALDAPVVVVAVAGLGTLNHTALTCEALAARKIIRKGVVIGSWPRHPGLAEHTNLSDLEAVTGEPLAGIMPENAGQLDRPGFLAAARAGLAPHLGGTGPSLSAS